MSVMQSINFGSWMLLLQLGSTLTMVGLIWFVQVVHYPLFAKIGRSDFRHYEMEHQRLTTYVVAPLMAIELGSALMLLWFRPEQIALISVWSGLGLLMLIWLMTYTVQVPQHTALVMCYDQGLQRRLVMGNWFRTAAWTLRGALVLWMVAELVVTTQQSSSAELLAAAGAHG